MQIDSDHSLSLPEHIGIIMDGNGRWAQKRNIPRSMGHKEGANTFRVIVRHCSEIGIKHLTFFAFSTENWKRPQKEVDFLIKLFKKYLEEALRDFKEENIKIVFLGDITAFPPNLQDLIKKAQDMSASKSGMILNLAMNYGGRDEIVRAVKSIAKDVNNSIIKVQDITENMVSQRLYTKGQPDLDLIIRPGGEHRISNFLLWQSAYAEYLSVDVLWPDFTPENINRALEQFSARKRRFGGI